MKKKIRSLLNVFLMCVAVSLIFWGKAYAEDGFNQIFVNIGNNNLVQVTLSNASGIGENDAVYFATWGENGGQNDIVWYKAAYAGAGAWTCTIDLADIWKQVHIIFIFILNRMDS